MLTKADLESSRNYILARVNAEFDALSAKLNPPASDLGVKFAAHRYFWSGPVVAGMSFRDLQAGPSVNPASFTGEKYRYASTARIQPPSASSDQSGWTELLRPGLVGDGWLAHANGKPVTRNSGSQSLLDLGDLGLISAVQSNLPNLLSGYDGLYLDEVNQELMWGWPVYPVEFSTPVSWRTTLSYFVARLSTTLRSLNKKLWINLGADYDASDPWQASLIQSADGINIEQFVGREMSGYPPATGPEWLRQVNFLQQVEASGKQVHVHAASATQSVVDFAFGSYLLGTGFLGSFSASSTYDGAVTLPSPGLLAAARKLGAPTGAYTMVASTAGRSFTNGSVSVNLNTETTTVGLTTP